MLLLLLLLLLASPVQASGIYQYNICNGLSNQLLYHSASIAIAVEQGKEVVEIPNHFIIHGEQATDESVLPSATNSVPLVAVFDSVQLVQHIEQRYSLRVRFVTLDFTKRQIPCAGLQSLHQADARIVWQILQAFRPSERMKRIITKIQQGLRDLHPPSVSLSSAAHRRSNDEEPIMPNGICVHHRDGPDWYDHCARWSSIRDGIYRGNCLGVPGRSFLESLEDRGLQDNDDENNNKFVYYCGDHDIPRELRKSAYHVYSRKDFLTPADTLEFMNLKQQQQQQQATTEQQPKPPAVVAALPAALGVVGKAEVMLSADRARDNGGSSSSMRDLWALIDFYVCRGLQTFIGNSVSTFSAIQIALRDGNHAYWYNSQSIPLGDIWRVYQIPIVYTYTELSQKSGKHLLQASIMSVRHHMPHNKIHILYHGKDDTAFRAWLTQRKVEIHQHDPVWRNHIEEMRKNGNPAASHLFLHAGNYFGTWQRIDIPLMIHQEYVLLLDADTVLQRPFTLADFGLDMTYSVAMSSEMVCDRRPVNAGVMLMNIPYMRHTYHDFLEFIMQHVHSAIFNNPAPSDQGAYLEFYESEARFLSRSFNFKPYYNPSDVQYEEPYIVHFHGAKPHDYLKHIVGDSCDQAVRGLCSQVAHMPSICMAFQLFARFSKAVDPVAYCNESFAKNKNEALFCNDILDALVSKKDQCTDLPYLIRNVLSREPEELDLPKEIILRNLSRGLSLWEVIAALVTIIAAMGWYLRRSGVRLITWFRSRLCRGKRHVT